IIFLLHNRSISKKDYTPWANFNGANFTGNVVFIDVNFNSADFTGATFSGNADFTGAKFNKVYFYNAKFNKVILNESDYTTMIGSFSPFQDTLVFNDATYIKLMKNFKDNGQFDDADVVVYKYRQIKQESKKGVSWLWDEIQRLIYGYGTKPENSLLAGLITIFLFSYSFERNSDQIRIQWDVFFKKSIRIIYKIVPSWFFDKFILLANKIPPNRIYEKFKLTLKKCLYYLTPTWDGFYYSWITFITVGYIDTKINRQRLATMVEGLLGWLILSLFIVSLANQIIKQ
ncbi:pentapeptide repeat-containing protein, partial [Candidatus Methanoperedens sp. BLZ2]|uniref:pentapeptide repeat-containing protein n=1 Tax=Candidatus Methanoperedens sp. BLZ2 TaxID=2035255 RepID=UPI001596EFA5